MLWIVAAGCLLAGAACAACAAWAAWSHRRQHWARRGVPHEPPHPLLGSLTFLQRENPLVWLRRIYKQHAPAPYVGVWLFWRPALVVMSPEIARNILVKDSDAFRNRLLSGGDHDPIGSLNIFTANDPLWTPFRRRLTPLFTASKLRALYPVMMQKTKEVLQRINQENEKKNKIDMRNMYTDYTTDVIGNVSFGIDSNATLTGDSPMRRITRDFMQYSRMRGISWCCIFFLPEVVKFFRFTLFPKSSTDYFRKVFAHVVQQRGGWRRPAPGNKDLLDALVNIKQEAKLDGEEITEDMLVAQAAVFLQAGFDTTGVALTYATYELAYNTEIQEKLYAELKEAKDRLGGADFDSGTLAELDYLNCVIKETLRKYPAMGWLDRVANRRYQVDDQLTIEAGTPVFVCAAGMHGDARYFPAPERFQPERFLPSEEQPLPFTYMPFGEGPRNCIGMRFGLQSLRSVLAHVVLSFSLRLPAGALPPNDVPVDRRGMFIAPDIVLSVDFVPRA